MLGAVVVLEWQCSRMLRQVLDKADEDHGHNNWAKRPSTVFAISKVFKSGQTKADSPTALRLNLQRDSHEFV